MGQRLGMIRFLIALLLTFAVGASTAWAGLYSDAVLIDSPLAYYQLGGTTGTNAADSAGTNDATYQSAIVLGQSGPNPTGGFLGFDSTNMAPSFGGAANDYISMPSGFLPTADAKRTIEGWFYSTNDTTNAAQTWFNYGPNSSGDRVSITATNDRVAVAVSGHNYGKTGLGLDAGWHHLAVVKPAGETTSNKFKIYVDGSEVTGLGNLAGSAQTISTVDSNQRIGRSSGTETYMGYIDEVAVYDQPLTATQIAAHYQTALTGDLNFHGPNFVHDSRMRLTQPDENGGTSNGLILGSNGSVDNWAPIRFDTSLLAGQIATGDATLRLTVNTTMTSNAATDNDTIGIHEILPTNVGWVEGTGNLNPALAGEVTYGNLAYDATTPTAWQDGTGANQNNLNGAINAPSFSTHSQASYTAGDVVDLTIPQALVQQWLDGTNPGIVVRIDGADNASRVSFASSEHTTRDGPQLIVGSQPGISTTLAPSVTQLAGFNGTATDTAALGYQQWDEVADDSGELYVRERTDGSNVQRRTQLFFEFDLDGLDPNLPVEKAWLRIYQYDKLNGLSAAANTEDLELARVTGDWDTDGSNFAIFDTTAVADEFIFGSNQDFGSAQASDGYYGGDPGDPTNRDGFIDITNFVQGWLDGSFENHGLRVSFADKALVGVAFDHISLTVTQQVPEPSTFALAFFGLLGMLGYVRRRRSSR